MDIIRYRADDVVTVECRVRYDCDITDQFLSVDIPGVFNPASVDRNAVKLTKPHYDIGELVECGQSVVSIRALSGAVAWIENAFGNFDTVSVKSLRRRAQPVAVSVVEPPALALDDQDEEIVQ